MHSGFLWLGGQAVVLVQGKHRSGLGPKFSSVKSLTELFKLKAMLLKVSLALTV
jgi:hypothetical protein